MLAGIKQIIEETADEIMEACIDPRGLSVEDVLDDDQGAMLHTKTIEILAGRFGNFPVTKEVARLVIAARIVAFENQRPESLKELDAASEAFSALVPYENDAG